MVGSNESRIQDERRGDEERSFFGLNRGHYV